MSLPEEVQAIRTTTAWCEASHVVVLRVSGEAAFATLDALCPAALSLQDTQLRATVLLREDGTVFADVYVARDDERYFLLSEGPSPAELEAHVRAHAVAGELQLERLDQTHQVLAVHGPWAWDLLSECLGPDVLGMPYLSFLRCEGGTLCFRAGKTGEFGYELLIPNAEVEAFRSRLLTQGRERGLVQVSLEALDQCALENWFFNIRKEGRAGLTPLELGLQWRLAPGKAFVGAAALKDRKVDSRLTCLVSDGALSPLDVVLLEEKPSGKVITAGFSPTLKQWVGAALLELPLAVPGITGLSISGHAAKTVSPPVINNRSLYVSPQRHTWADRNSPELNPPPSPSPSPSPSPRGGEGRGEG